VRRGIRRGEGGGAAASPSCWPCCLHVSNLAALAAQEMIDEADRDGDGEINEEEFLRIMKKTSLY